jgi:hypothetical protein
MSVYVSAPPVENEQEALTLMFHHLELAAAYFEETPRAISPIPDTHSRPAVCAWLAEMEALYPEGDD